MHTMRGLPNLAGYVAPAASPHTQDALCYLARIIAVQTRQHIGEVTVAANSELEMTINRNLPADVLLAVECADRQVKQARTSEHYKHEQSVVLSIAQYEALRRQVYTSPYRF